MSDPVKKPSHYNAYIGFEVMDVCRQLKGSDGDPAGTWFRSNTAKYLLRAGLKDPGNLTKEIQDLEKAYQYLGLEIERLKKLDRDRKTTQPMDLRSSAPSCSNCNLPMIPDHLGNGTWICDRIENHAYPTLMRDAINWPTPDMSNDEDWMQAGADPEPTIIHPDTGQCAECGEPTTPASATENVCPKGHGFWNQYSPGHWEWQQLPLLNGLPVLFCQKPECDYTTTAEPRSNTGEKTKYCKNGHGSMTPFTNKLRRRK